MKEICIRPMARVSLLLPCKSRASLLTCKVCFLTFLLECLAQLVLLRTPQEIPYMVIVHGQDNYVN